jgi:hypothetical protein
MPEVLSRPAWPPIDEKAKNLDADIAVGKFEAKKAIRIRRSSSTGRLSENTQAFLSVPPNARIG